MSGFASAQPPLPELEKIKQIKLLESTSDDVKRILAGYEENLYVLDNFHYSAKYYSFNIYYSSGSCSDENEDWNVPQGKVSYIIIHFKKTVKPEDLGIDLSSFRKEKMFVDSSEDFIYHDKNAGISYNICNAGNNCKGEISSIELFPPKEKLPLLCSNKTERKEFYERKRWSNEKSKKPHIRYFANVSKVTLSANEIIAGCDSGNQSCADGNRQIEVLVDAEASPCTSWDFKYNYTITGGRIIGQGEKVVWDLSGAKPGRYLITADVDNGCGICGTTKTEFVDVKECADCLPK